jgi:hypothetical protein
VLLIQDAGVVQPYQNEFIRLWNQLPPYWKESFLPYAWWNATP